MWISPQRAPLAAPSRSGLAAPNPTFSPKRVPFPKGHKKIQNFFGGSNRWRRWRYPYPLFLLLRCSNCLGDSSPMWRSPTLSSRNVKVYTFDSAVTTRDKKRDFQLPLDGGKRCRANGALNCTGSAAPYTARSASGDPIWWQEYRDILIADTFVDLTRLKLRAQQANPPAAPARAPAKRHPPSRAEAAYVRTLALLPHTPLFACATDIDDAIAGRAVRDQRRGLEVPARRIKGTCVKSAPCSFVRTRKSWLPCACAQAHCFVLLTMTARLPVHAPHLFSPASDHDSAAFPHPPCLLSSFSPCSLPPAGQVRGGLNHEKTL
jgi:hypothetical protein